MLKRKFRKKRDSEMDFSLQITSLADVLIIVLVFLLNTMGADLRGAAVELSIPKNLKLPEAKLSGGMENGLVIEVSENGVRMGIDNAATLTNFRFSGSDLKKDLPNSSSSTILSAAFAAERQKNVPVETPVLIVADRHAPYATIQTVVASAALNGFTNVKLAVIAKK